MVWGAYNGIVDTGVFINNTAGHNGGAIYWYGGNGTIKNSNFTNNRATGETLQYDLDLKYDDVIIVNDNELLDNILAGKLYVLNYAQMV